MTNSEWVSKLPKSTGYYWARHLSHNGPSHPFVVWVYRVQFGRYGGRDHWRMVNMNGQVITDKEAIGLYEFLPEKFVCPNSELPPRRNWLEVDDERSVREKSK